MSENSDVPSGWYRETMERLYDAEDVVDFAPVGPRDQPEDPDFISVKLVQGNDSDALNDVLGYDNFVILSAYVSDSGELIIDIVNPKHLEKFINIT